MNLNEVFGFNIDYFVKNTISDFLIYFLNHEGKVLLTNEAGNILSLLRDNQEKRAAEYTKDLLKRQTLQLVDTAWNNKNYQDFIIHFSNLDLENLPKSYILKYEIARKNSQPKLD